MQKCAWRKCVRTGFEPKRPNQKYCSPRCANCAWVDAHRNRRRSAVTDHNATIFVEPSRVVISEERICEFCKSPFQTIPSSARGGMEQRFCRKNCRRNAFNKRQALRV